MRIYGPELGQDEDLSAIVGRHLLGWANAIEGLGSLRRSMVEAGLRKLEPVKREAATEVADGHAQLSELLFAAGDPDGAARHARVAWSLLAGRPGDWLLANKKVRVARTLVEQKLHNEADQLLLAGHETLLDVFGPGNPDVESARELLVENYIAWGKPEKARAFVEPTTPTR